jgi:flagellin-specific chaperone FliS
MNGRLSAYRLSAADSATHIDVLLAAYDALAEDLRLAGAAAAIGDVAARCRYSEHAHLVLGHLQNWIPLLENAALEESLTTFYEYLRSRLLCLQACVEVSQFSALAMCICETRAAWQKKKAMLLSSEFPAALQDESLPEVSAQGRRLYCSA